MIPQLPSHCSEKEAARRKQVARLLGIELVEYGSGSPLAYTGGYATKLVGGVCDGIYAEVGYSSNYHVGSSLVVDANDLPKRHDYLYVFASVGKFKFVKELDVSDSYDRYF